MKASAIQCPRCGASLARVEGAASIVCRYCATNVEVDVAPPNDVAPSPPRSGAPLLAIAGAIVVLVVVAIVVVATRPSAQTSARTSAPAIASAPAQTAPLASAPAIVAPSASAAAPSLADLALEFGEKGTGPGQLEDARAIAVDPNGDVYVADYMSLRVQRFDGSGKFVAAFRIKEGNQEGVIKGLAATYDGHLWVARDGDLIQLKLPDGKVVRTVPNQKPKVSYGAIAVDATNTIYAQNYGIGTFISTDGRLPQSDNLRKLDKSGNLLTAWKDVGGGFGGLAIAVDDVGTIVLAERGRIDVLDAKGKVQARFSAGSDGGGVALDGKGRIFFSSFRGIGVCDTSGRAIGTIGTANVRGLAMGKSGRLHAVTNDGRVLVYALR